MPVNRARFARADRITKRWDSGCGIATFEICVDAEAVVVHTGKDLHPECKRLDTLAFYKTAKKSVEFFESWPADSDSPTDQLFCGSLEEIEEATGYDPDDAAPWSVLSLRLRRKNPVTDSGLLRRRY